jgi:hypothetical protein
MKLIALHNESGKIVAAVRVSYDYQGPVPVAGEKTRVVTVDVPQGHEKLDLATICTRFRVDPQTSELVEHKA